MNDKEQATRLADALESGTYLLSVERSATAALLRRWPDGEPVAWMYKRKRDGHKAAVTKQMDAALEGADGWTETPLYTAPPDQSERIAALEADRDSWAEQASQRVADCERFIERIAALEAALARRDQVLDYARRALNNPTSRDMGDAAVRAIEEVRK